MPSETRASGFAWAGLALLAFGLFALNVADHLLANSLCCGDDAFIAVAAKNLAGGRGYTSTYRPTPEGDTAAVAFDPLISTGPVLVLPAAAAIRLLGNRYWVPGCIVAVSSLLLLLGLGWQLARRSGEPRRWAPAAIAGLVALNLITIGYYEHWYTLIGEVPALLLASLGVVLLAGGRREWRDAAGGGLLLGLAFETKTVALPALVVGLACLLLRASKPKSGGAGAPVSGTWRDGLRRGLPPVALAVALSLAPLASFETYKVANLGLSGYQASRDEAAAVLRSAPGSGLAGLRGADPLAYVRLTTATNWQALGDYFGSSWGTAAFLLSLALLLTPRRRALPADSLIPPTLAAIAALYVLWWLPLAGRARIRYLLIGLGLWCCAVVFDLALGRRNGRRLALAAAFAAALLPRATHAGWIAPPRPWFSPSPRTTAMLQTAQFLAAHRQGRVIAADWWATGVDMEYLLPGSSNIVHHLALERLNSPWTLFLDNKQWMDLSPGVRDRWDATLARFGATAEFAAGPYRVSASPPLSAALQPIVIVDVDTLGAKHLGTYGYRRETSPNIDAFAREAIRFEWAFSQAPNTPPSQTSILTGLYPSTHGRIADEERLSAAATTLAEALRAKGATTAAFVDGGFMGAAFGIDQGFDTFRDFEAAGLAKIGPAALRFIDEHRREPFFVLVHTYDVHWPYRPPEPFRSRFVGGLAPHSPGFEPTAERMEELRQRSGSLPPNDLAFAEARYDGGVRYVDAWFGKLIEHLRQLGLLERTTVVLLSDHGEEFQEHGSVGHDRLNATVTHIPLLIRLPGGARPRSVPQAVESIDVMPTLLELSGVPPTPGLQGHSLAPLLRGQGGAGVAAVSESPFFDGSRAITLGDYRLLLRLKDGQSKLYRFREDPDEQNDLAASQPQVVEQLRRALAGWQSMIARSRLARSDRHQLDAETLRSLRALGYVR